MPAKKSRGLPEPALRRNKVVQRMTNHPEMVRAHYNSLRRVKKRWFNFRTFEACNDFVRHWTRVDMLDELEHVSKHGRKIVKALDDGCGQGFFLEGLKLGLLDRHVMCETTGLTLSRNPELVRREGVSIDRLVVGRAERFIPTEKYDLIFSMAGSINYVPQFVQRDHFLKLVHALTPKGVMVVGFMYHTTQTPAMQEYERKPRLSYKEHLEGIRRALEKQGFTTKLREEVFSQGFPDMLLIIRRAPAPI